MIKIKDQIKLHKDLAETTEKLMSAIDDFNGYNSPEIRQKIEVLANQLWEAHKLLDEVVKEVVGKAYKKARTPQS